MFYKITIKDYDTIYHLLSVVLSHLFFSVTLRGMQNYFLNISDERLMFIGVSSEHAGKYLTTNIQLSEKKCISV